MRSLLESSSNVRPACTATHPASCCLHVLSRWQQRTQCPKSYDSRAALKSRDVGPYGSTASRSDWQATGCSDVCSMHAAFRGKTAASARGAYPGYSRLARDADSGCRFAGRGGRRRRGATCDCPVCWLRRCTLRSQHQPWLHRGCTHLTTSRRWRLACTSHWGGRSRRTLHAGRRSIRARRSRWHLAGSCQVWSGRCAGCDGFRPCPLAALGPVRA